MDIFANQGIALAIFGYFGFILKDLPQMIWEILKQHFSISILVTTEDVKTFKATHEYCRIIYPKLKQHTTTTINMSKINEGGE